VFTVHGDCGSTDDEELNDNDEDVGDNDDYVGTNDKEEGDEGEDDVDNVVDLHDDEDRVCYLAMMSAEPTTFESKLTLAKNCFFGNSRKKNVVWDYYGYLCPDKNPK
jgi:hypothetical protein